MKNFIDKYSIFKDNRIKALHAVIFLGGFIIIGFIFFLRNTLGTFFLGFSKCCKSVIERFTKNDSLSYNIYSNLSALSLF